MSNLFLYLIATLIWGSTWLAITFQYGIVPASASVAYRFLLAGLIMLTWCAIRKERLHFNPSEFTWSALQGVLLFGVSYMLVYEAERHIASGLMAVLNSAMLLFNLAGMRIAFAQQLNRKSLLGASLGVLGIVLVFWPEVTRGQSTSNWIGIACGVAAALLASLGNLVAQRNRNANIPLLPSTAYGMLVGGAVALVFTLLRDRSLVFDIRPAYVASLFYLAVFGSVFAFAAYLAFMGRIGAGRAGYIAIAVPILALLLSAIFEAYAWRIWTVAGIVCAAAGNVVMLADSEQIRRVLGLKRKPAPN
ncbi:MAG TPA: EamA family transporter [Rhodocyclaceae bacterium]|nr:EamA family transporter [Rhodocyclaceae bacterium]